MPEYDIGYLVTCTYKDLLRLASEAALSERITYKQVMKDVGLMLKVATYQKAERDWLEKKINQSLAGQEKINELHNKIT